MGIGGLRQCKMFRLSAWWRSQSGTVAAHPPLFQVMLAFIDNVAAGVELSGLMVWPLEIDRSGGAV